MHEDLEGGVITNSEEGSIVYAIESVPPGEIYMTEEMITGLARAKIASGLPRGDPYSHFVIEVIAYDLLNEIADYNYDYTDFFRPVATVKSEEQGHTIDYTIPTDLLGRRIGLIRYRFYR